MIEPGDSSSAAIEGLLGKETGPPPRLMLEIVREDGDWRQFGPVEPAIAAVAAAVAERLAVDRAEAVVALSSDAHVRALNHRFRGQDRPTNVLSFPAARGGGDRPTRLGDIVLAAETVAREAAERDLAPNHHLQHLVVHGLLHLAGYDHETDAAALEMERLEVEILAALGVADPYAQALVAPGR